MGIITITERDIKASIIVTPAWYRVRIDATNEKTAKSGTSQNHFMEGTVLFDGDTGDTKFAGVPTPKSWLFNEGYIALAVGFLEVCGANVGGKGGRFNLEDAVGKEIDIFIENDLYDGRTVNKINHKYRKPNPNVTAVETTA